AAGLFEHPLLTRELEHIRAVRIDVARPGQTFCLTKAVYFCGWLAAMLGWEVTTPLHDVADGDAFAGTFRSARHEVKVELRASRASQAGNGLSAGSLIRVQVE